MPDAFKISEFYSVCCRPYYIGGDGGSVLNTARRDYFTQGKTVKGTVRAVENGQEVKTRYRIGANCFHWKKVCGRTVLQEVFWLSNGIYRLVSHDLSGQLLSAESYDSGLHWIQTAYYDGNPAKPAVVLKREKENITCFQYDPIAGGYGETSLLPSPWEPGTAAQSYINGKAGEPQVTAWTDAGGFCFCLEEEQKLRLSVLEQLKKNKNILVPEWPSAQKDESLNFHVIPNDGAAPVAPIPVKSVRPTVTPMQNVPAAEKTVVESGQPLHKITEKNEEKTQEASSVYTGSGSDYAANHEIFAVDEPPKEKTASVPKPQAANDSAKVKSSKYAVAAKGLSGGVVHAAALAKKDAEQSAPAADLKAGSLIPARRIIVSSMESYLYFGKLIDGLRQGQGRTQMENGHTAYEGGYLNDKRDGFGVYYYKSGKICYVGGWKQNLRSGMGVAFGSGDGSIFVGHWKDGAATGLGSEFDMLGNLTYTGGWKEGRRHGLGTEYRDGCVFRTGQWYEDKFCSGYGRVEGSSEAEVQ